MANTEMNYVDNKTDIPYQLVASKSPCRSDNNSTWVTIPNAGEYIGVYWVGGKDTSSIMTTDSSKTTLEYLGSVQTPAVASYPKELVVFYKITTLVQNQVVYGAEASAASGLAIIGIQA